MQSKDRILFAIVVLLLCLPASAEVAKEAETPAPLAFVEGSWTLAVLPDTQIYAELYPDIFTGQTRWIVKNRASRNIALVLHEGDIVNHNIPEQWANAKNSLALLDGVVPYVLVPGNHDLPGRLNEYFPVDLYRSLPTFGGVYQRGRLDNSYHLFRAGDRNWLVIALQWGPRDGVVRWASKVLDKYPNRTAIIVTHAYLYSDNTRYDHVNRSDQSWCPSVNDGQELWQKLVSKHANVAFVFCGHMPGVGRLTSEGIHGNRVHQLLANYQSCPEGGEGYMRLIEFLPDGKTVQVKTYSPYLDRYLTNDQEQFVLDLPPAISETK